MSLDRNKLKQIPSADIEKRLAHQAVSCPESHFWQEESRTMQKPMQTAFPTITMRREFEPDGGCRQVQLLGLNKYKPASGGRLYDTVKVKEMRTEYECFGFGKKHGNKGCI